MTTATAKSRTASRAARSPEARQLADEGYVILRGAIANMDAFKEVHARSVELRKLIDACGFETRLAALMPAMPRMELMESLYSPFATTRASDCDKREMLCGLWLPLDGSSLLNGALFGWSGSHKVVKPRIADYVKDGDYSRDLTVTLLNAGLKPRFIDADPGDVVAWAGGFAYGVASPTVPDMPGRSLLLHYGARGA